MEGINSTYGPTGPIAPSIPICEEILTGIIQDLTDKYALLRPVSNFYSNNYMQCGWDADVCKHVRRASERHVSCVWNELAASLA